MDVQQTTINAVRILSAEAIQKAKSGHPGLPMGSAPIGYTLFQNFLKFNPRDPRWDDRDRFILSAGHGSMLDYSLLYLYGYDLKKEDLMNFRQLGSRTPGHPEYGHTAGVETTTALSARASPTAWAWRSQRRIWPQNTISPASPWWITIRTCCAATAVSRKGFPTRPAPLRARTRWASSFSSTTTTTSPSRATRTSPSRKTWARGSRRRIGRCSTSISVTDPDNVEAVSDAIRKGESPLPISPRSSFAIPRSATAPPSKAAKNATARLSARKTCKRPKKNSAGPAKRPSTARRKCLSTARSPRVRARKRKCSGKRCSRNTNMRIPSSPRNIRWP